MLTKNTQITFGKYSGKTYGEILKENPSYGKWMELNWSKISQNNKPLITQKITNKESNFIAVPNTTGKKHICHLCLTWVFLRDDCRFCEACVTYNSNVIPKIVLLRNKKKQNEQYLL